LKKLIAISGKLYLLFKMKALLNAIVNKIHQIGAIEGG